MKEQLRAQRRLVRIERSRGVLADDGQKLVREREPLLGGVLAADRVQRDPRRLVNRLGEVLDGVFVRELRAREPVG
jgi:hypothetical protein